MDNIIAIFIILAVLGGAIGYIIYAKKHGVHCIGCPSSGKCSGHCSGCSSCGCHAQAEEKEDVEDDK